VGEHVILLPAERALTRGCAGLAMGDSLVVPPGDLDWTVTPSTGRVVGDYFVADEPGTYKLAPSGKPDTAGGGVAGVSPGLPLGSTLTIKVVAAAAGSSETTGSDVAASIDTPGSSADAPLAGTWSYEGMKVTGTGASATWAYAPNPGTLVIEKRPEGYYLQISEGTSVATLDGANVVLERNFPSLGTSVRYTGVLSGDTITGSQHTVANGAAHDDPWTATRVK
jgi:hypothetical protein